MEDEFRCTLVALQDQQDGRGTDTDSKGGEAPKRFTPNEVSEKSIQYDDQAAMGGKESCALQLTQGRQEYGQGEKIIQTDGTTHRQIPRLGPMRSQHHNATANATGDGGANHQDHQALRIESGVMYPSKANLAHTLC